MRIQKTKDGSHTLKSKEFGELYHSSNGSFQEANHIFIKHGIASNNLKEINIFEMGFGTGLNAILTYYYALENNIKVNYYTIEAYPVELETVTQLNYNEFIKQDTFNQIFEKMHLAIWNEEVKVSETFNLFKINSKIEDYNFNELKEKIDIIYYDAFAPNAQENLWQEEVLNQMFKILKEDSFLITYCAKGVFKRTLKFLGFHVEGLPGPIGKREITKAVKK